MTVEEVAERAGRWWRRLTPGARQAFAVGAALTVILAVVLVAVFDIEGPILLVGGLATAALWKRRGAVRTRFGRLSHPSSDPVNHERERRRALIEKYGHVPLADLAASEAPFAEVPPPVYPRPATPEELALARRQGLLAKHGHMPLTDLADPTYIPPPPAVWEPAPSRPEGKPTGTLPAQEPVPSLQSEPSSAATSRRRARPFQSKPGQNKPGQSKPGASVATPTAKPIVESRRPIWRRPVSRPGSIVE